MPTSITALLIIIIAVFPGLIGDRVYQFIVGVDWREKEFRTVLRLIGFSVVGVAIYSLVADLFGWPIASHLFPQSYENIQPSSENLNQIFIPYAGHLAGGFLAGVMGALGIKILAWLTPGSIYPGAWDDFIRSYVKDHWVIISLSSGEVYAGKLKTADVSVATEERDLVIEEPCKYVEETKQYRAINYQFFFIPAKEIYSIAVVHNPDLDTRTIPIGDNLFSEGNDNEEKRNN